MKIFQDVSNIGQLDGQDSIVSDTTNSDDQNNDDTEYATDEEVFSEPIPANLFPIPNQVTIRGEPIPLQVGLRDLTLSSLPLFSC